MPTYFFHTQNGMRVVDDTGTELANDAAAHREAIKLAGAILHDEPQLLRRGREFRTEVVDEAGVALFTVIATIVPNAAPGA